jgi:glycosyltransferase involved in cell wall biosynthesis
MAMHRTRKLTVLNVAFPLLPVTAGSGGGAEQILHLIERGIVDAGHRSIVVAAKGSEIAGELIETPAVKCEITEKVRADAQRKHACAIEQAIARTHVDVVHFHGLDFCAYRPHNDLPKLATLHLPTDWYPPSIFEDSSVQLNCVSKAQAASSPCPGLPVVLNGIDTQRYKFSERTRRYALWLGRICPEKGVDIALRVALRLDLPMIVAGPVQPFHDHEIYFAEKVKPLLDSKRQYIGAVDLDTKVQLLSEAFCVTIPSLVAETSSLVAMEALASGTPVIAFRSGALPEIVDHGMTGFIVDSEDEMEAAIGQIARISPDVCRSTALERFEASRMIGGYLALYERLIDARDTMHCG